MAYFQKSIFLKQGIRSIFLQFNYIFHYGQALFSGTVVPDTISINLIT